MNYHLLRTPNASIEGPYAISQVKAMFDMGQITTQAQVCREGHHQWQAVQPVLAAEWERNRQLQTSVKTSTERQSVEKLIKACWTMATIMLGLSLVPFLGVVVWFVYGLVGLAFLVLAIIMMTRNAVGDGIAVLAVGWIGLPVVMLICNLIGTGIGSALMGAVR